MQHAILQKSCKCSILKPCALEFHMIYCLGIEDYLVIWKQGAIVDGVSKALSITWFESRSGRTG